MKLLRSLSVYTFVGFFGAGINFLLMPVLSHYIPKEDYGIISLINTYVMLIVPLTGFVASGIISVDYYKISDKKEFASLFSSVQAIPVLPVLLLLLLSGLFYPQLAPLLELPLEDRWLVLSMFPIAIMTIYIDTMVNYQVIQKESTGYAVFNIAKVILELGLTVLFVIALGMTWKGRILSWFITSLVCTLVAFLYFRRKGLLTSDIRMAYIKRALWFGAPLILHTIGKFIVNQSDRLFIAKMISLEEAGVYNIGYTIGMVILIIATAFSNMFTPYLMERLSNLTEKAKTEIVRLSYLGIGVMAAAVVLLNLFAPLLFRYFIDEQYSAGVTYVFWISLGYLFWGVYLIFSGYVFFFKKNSFLAVLAIVNVVTNILFNYYLIKIFGGLGAAYATALSFLLICILIAWYTRKLVSLPWTDFGRVFSRTQPLTGADTTEQ